MTSERAPLIEFNRRDVMLLAALMLLAVVAMAPGLFAEASLAPGLPDSDARTQWWPWRAYAFDSIRAGKLPLWNPWVLCGTPFLGNMQSAMFYPPNLLFAVAPMGIAARLSILLHLWLSILFTWLLARLLQRGRAAAAIAALAFTFCAAQWLRLPAGHWGVSCAIPWLALVLFCVEWSFRRPGLLPVLAGAGAVAMHVLAGVPQYVLISGIAASLYALLRAFGERFPWRTRLARWASVAVMFVLGAALSAAQLVPGIEAARHGARSLPMHPEWVKQFSLGPENLLTLLAPGIFGGFGEPAYWGRYLVWEMNAYLGITVLCLALIGLIAGQPRQLAAWCGAGAAAMLLLALGRHTPVMGVLSALLPFGDMFRGAAKFLLPFSLFAALLAAMGAHWLLASDPRVKRTRAIVVMAAIALPLALLLLAPLPAATWLGNVVERSGETFASFNSGQLAERRDALVRSAGVALAFVAALALVLAVRRKREQWAAPALVGIVALDLVLFAVGFFGRETCFTIPKVIWPGLKQHARDYPEYRAWLPDHPELNDGMVAGVRTVEGIEPNPPVHIHTLLRVSQGQSVEIAPSIYQLLYPERVAKVTAMMNLIEPVSGRLVPADWESARARGKDMPATRAEVVRGLRIAEGTSKALRETLQVDPRDEVVLEEWQVAPQEETAAAAASRGSGGRADILLDEPDWIVIQVRNYGIPCWLVLQDSFFPGWVADIDGKPVEILRANFAFRAVALPEGDCRVTFRYRPASFQIGLAVSLVALLLSAGALLRGRRR